jgi:tRNA 2-thiouridine synthesizing protein D
LRYTLICNCAPYSQQGARSAYHFATALINKGHTINSIFFYGLGIFNTNGASQVASDELNVTHSWQALAKNHQIPLKVCSSAAERHGLTGTSLLEPATLTGLGDLMGDLTNSERVIVFHA